MYIAILISIPYCACMDQWISAAEGQEAPRPSRAITSDKEQVSCTFAAPRSSAAEPPQKHRRSPMSIRGTMHKASYATTYRPIYWMSKHLGISAQMCRAPHGRSSALLLLQSSTIVPCMSHERAVRCEVRHAHARIQLATRSMS